MHLPRHAEIWLPGVLRSMTRSRREARQREGVVDILLAIVDHYEPLHGDVSDDVGAARVAAWSERYPALASSFADADGRPPQHTFFYPVEQYRPAYLDALATLCQRGFGEVEIHLHHDRDTATNLRQQLAGFARTLRDGHGLLPSAAGDTIAYAFIHGNWALGNSLPDGRWCGVDDELAVLRETGCYADFTFPAAPSPAQTRSVNLIYYADTDAAGPRSHDRGRRAAVGQAASPRDLLLVQGPLVASWRQRKWGLVPGVDNGSLHGGYPPTLGRFKDWLSCGISVERRPEWVFVKVYTHGAPERNAATLLGPETAAFHRDILARYNDGQRHRLHYVTAREMANIIHAAEDGQSGDPGQYRDYRLGPPPVMRSASRG
jgi:hypothetical protein